LSRANFIPELCKLHLAENRYFVINLCIGYAKVALQTAILFIIVNYLPENKKGDCQVALQFYILHSPLGFSPPLIKGDRGDQFPSGIATIPIIYPFSIHFFVPQG
jgi:hypothetical protein